MISVAASVDIDRPVAEVFSFVADPANESSWHTDVVTARLEPDGPPGPGKVMHGTYRSMGRTFPGVADVTAFEEDRRIVYRFRGRTMGMEPTVTYLFEPVGERTKFTRRLDVVPRGPIRLAAPLLRLMMKKANATFARNLKLRLETPQ